jgi:hypothetical protein
MIDHLVPCIDGWTKHFALGGEVRDGELALRGSDLHIRTGETTGWSGQALRFAPLLSACTAQGSRRNQSERLHQPLTV